MKITNLITMILLTFSVHAQTVEYKYDNAGNRYQRSVLMFEAIEEISSALNDTSLLSRTVSTVNIVGTVDRTNYTIFPNPNGGQFDISFENWDINTNVTIKIYTLDGTEILSKKLQESVTTMDIRDRENGIYLLSIISGSNKSNWKIIKQ